MPDGKQPPAGRVLYIDLDIMLNKVWMQNYKRNANHLLKPYGLHPTSIRITPSQNKGMHARIYLNKAIPAETQLLLQFLLCDDHARTGFNMARVKLGYSAWNKLHEPADWDYRRRHIPTTRHSSGRNKNPNLRPGGA